METNTEDKKKPKGPPQWELEQIAASITRKTGRYVSPEWVRDNVWIAYDKPKVGYMTF